MEYLLTAGQPLREDKRPEEFCKGGQLFAEQQHFHPVRVAGNAIKNEKAVLEYQQRDKADGKANPVATCQGRIHHFSSLFLDFPVFHALNRGE